MNLLPASEEGKQTEIPNLKPGNYPYSLFISQAECSSMKYKLGDQLSPE